MRDPVIFDIETVSCKDLSVYKSVKCPKCEHRPEDHPKQKKDYCQECDKEAPLRWTTSKIVCVTAKIVDGELFSFCGPDELKVLSESYDLLSELVPNPWISFNGKEFDIIQLQMRGLVHNVPYIDILPHGKYSKNSFDLYDELVGGKWNRQQAASLEMFAAILGFKDLIYGNGRMVEQWYKDGKFDEISRHCNGDVLATEKLYKKVVEINKMYRKHKDLPDDVETISI